MVFLGNHSISTYTKLSQQLTFFYLLIRKRTCAYQRVWNNCFLENFAYVLNEWTVTRILILFNQHDKVMLSAASSHSFSWCLIRIYKMMMQKHAEKYDFVWSAYFQFLTKYGKVYIFHSQTPTIESLFK